MQTLSGSILTTLAYFDMFSYPLLPEEILLFLDQPANAADLGPSITELEREGRIFRIGPFYSIHNDNTLAQRRKDGNARALPLLKTADRIGRLLYHFPFVRGIGVSGSLSKKFADSDADIDFFIITAPNRLWVARTLMHFLKKLSFLTGRQHWLCMNYYVSTDALLIAEKNIFTATEVITLLPVCGKAAFESFFTANNWVTDFFPNVDLSNSSRVKDRRTGIVKSHFEKLLAGRFGTRLDDHWMNVTAKRWQQKQDHRRMNNKGQPLALKTSKQTARPAPENFQKKILELYAVKLQLLEQHQVIAS